MPGALDTRFDESANPSDSLRALAARGEVRKYRKGSVLIEEGDLGDTLYIVLRGRLRAYSVGADDREITYGFYGAGEYVGELSLDGGRRSASVMVVEPTTCAVVTRPTLERHLSEDPAFAFELLAKVIRRARVLSVRAKELSLNDVYGRLVNLLDAAAEPLADGTRVVTQRITHQEMANQLGCSRGMVTRLLSDLARSGALRNEEGRLRLLRPLPPKW